MNASAPEHSASIAETEKTPVALQKPVVKGYTSVWIVRVDSVLKGIRGKGVLPLCAISLNKSNKPTNPTFSYHRKHVRFYRWDNTSNHHNLR